MSRGERISIDDLPEPDFDKYPMPDLEDLTTQCARCGTMLGTGLDAGDDHDCLPLFAGDA